MHVLAVLHAVSGDCRQPRESIRRVSPADAPGSGPITLPPAMFWRCASLWLGLLFAGACLGQTTLPVFDLYSRAPLPRVKRDAENGNREAQLELGRRLLLGREVQIDPSAAMSWFGKAAARGSGDALFELYLCCRDGIGEPKNPEKAAKLLEAAAKAGHPRALIEQAHLALQAPAATGAKNPAIQTLVEAARKGNALAQLYLARAILAGHRIPGDFNAAQLLARAGASDDPRVAFEAVRVFRDGEGSARPDPARATAVLAKLAERGYRPAVLELARLAPDSFRAVAREQSPARIRKEVRLLNLPVTFDGELTRVAEGEWLIASGDPGQPVRIIPDGSGTEDARPGRYVRVWGVVEEPGVVRALLVAVPEPRLTYSYNVETAQSPAGAGRELYVVILLLRNTGRQAIQTAELLIELYQPESDRRAGKSVVVRQLAVGERRAITATFDAEEVRQRDNVNPVRAEVAVKRIEW
ncbi:MAG: hypothetical protein NZ561_05085 [Phycisphaerae bacterium]|nr:hypothetical protein [Phycisphaerae bacterium]